jgi:hypothetical protein
MDEFLTILLADVMTPVRIDDATKTIDPEHFPLQCFEALAPFGRGDS